MTTWMADNSIQFALFGLARQESWPGWVQLDWSKPILHLGPGKKIVKGAIDIDFPEFDFDHESITNGLPFDDGEVGGAIATHVLEHLAHPQRFIREIARVLAPGCPFNILVPHGFSKMYLQDLDHKKPYVLDTWIHLFGNEYYDANYGDDRIPFEIGANFKFALQEGNDALVTQLIKR